MTGTKTDRAALLRELRDRRISREGGLESRRVDELYVMLTLRCNLRCRACILWGKTGACKDGTVLRRHRRELPLPVLKRVIRELIPFSPRQVNLAGGEPLLSESCLPLARYARSEGVPVILTTNGVLLRRRYRQVLDAVDQVNVSLDGPPGVARRVRPAAPTPFRRGPRTAPLRGGRRAGPGGAAGYYRDMLMGLKALSALKRKRGGSGPVIRVLCVISEGNYDRLVELVDFLSRAGVDVDQYYFQHLIFNSADTLARQARALRGEFNEALRFWKGYRVSPGGMDLDRLHEELERLKGRHPGVRFSAELDRRGLESYYSPDRTGLAAGYCLGPWTQPNLLPDGTLWSCPDVALGNVRTASFGEIWNGSRARSVRERVRRRLFPACLGCFSYYTDLPKSPESRRRS